MRTELATARSEKEQLILALNLTGDANPLHQIRAPENESLLATVSNMSLGSLNIPECRPSEGETDVDKKAYEQWKEILNASFNLVRATNEQARMDIFRIKAGSKLLEVMQGTASTEGMPDERTTPFSNAIARLDQYFGSRTYIIGQRGKLISMVQLGGESNIAFVRRVAAAAKLCGYKSDEEMEAVVRTIVRGTADSRVRVLAQRNWVNQGDINSLIALVRDREMEILNEEEYQKTNRPTCSTIAAITQPAAPHFPFRRGMGSRPRGIHRGRRIFQQGQTRNQGTSRNVCWRCASIYHGPSECPSQDKVCHNCNRRGHLSRCCTIMSRLGVGQKRPHDDSADKEPQPKIAAITQNGEENIEQVLDNTNVD